MNRKAMSKSNRLIPNVIGKPSDKSEKAFGKNEGIANLLKHFNLDQSKVACYKDELVAAGWIAKSTTPSKLAENIAATAAYLSTPVPMCGAVKPVPPKERLSPDDEPEVEVIEDDPLFEYTSDEAIGAAEQYKSDMKKAERSLKKLRREAFIGKQKVNRMAIAASQVKPANVTLNVVDSGKSSGKYHCVLPISDLHFGEVVQPSASFGYNKYNPEIAVHRLMKLFEENYRFATMYGCDHLHILLLGDLISGEIHDELRETNAFSAPKCVSKLNSVLIGMILAYANKFKKVTISCVVGNHSRTGKKLQSKNRSQDNYEHIIYSTIKDRCEAEAKNITVEFDDEAPFLVTEVGNQKWMLEHGDRYKGSTAAAGAINTVLRQIGNDLRRNHAEVAIMGHWHTGAEGAVDAREDGRMTKVYINPSIVGPDEFATTVLHAYYPAESNLFITDGNDIVAKVAIDLSTVQE